MRKKTIILILLAAGTCSSCYPSVESMRPNMSPCQDSLMLTLNARPLDSLSSREYQYLSNMRHLCEIREEEMRSFKIADAQASYYTAWSWIISITTAIALVITLAPQK